VKGEFWKTEEFICQILVFTDNLIKEPIFWKVNARFSANKG